MRLPFDGNDRQDYCRSTTTNTHKWDANGKVVWRKMGEEKRWTLNWRRRRYAYHSPDDECHPEKSFATKWIQCAKLNWLNWTTSGSVSCIDFWIALKPAIASSIINNNNKWLIAIVENVIFLASSLPTSLSFSLALARANRNCHTEALSQGVSSVYSDAHNFTILLTLSRRVRFSGFHFVFLIELHLNMGCLFERTENYVHQNCSTRRWHMDAPYSQCFSANDPISLLRQHYLLFSRNCICICPPCRNDAVDS